jgi:hypothetical protein
VAFNDVNVDTEFLQVPRNTQADDPSPNNYRVLWCFHAPIPFHA